MRPSFNAPVRTLEHLAAHGPRALVGTVALGILVPSLAAAAHPLMGLACVVFTMGALLKADRAAFRHELRRPLRVLCMLVWASVGAPALAIGAVAMVGAAENDVAAGLLMGMVAPPAGASIAVATMLGLAPALALIGVVAATLVAPLTLPFLAAWAGGPGLAPNAWQLFVHSAAIIGLAALGAMRDVQEHVLRDPGLVCVALGGAFALNLGLQLAGAMLFAAYGRGPALTAGLLGGNRSFALAWAAAGAGLPAPTELALALCAIPLFVLPALYQRLGPMAAGAVQALLSRREARRMAGDTPAGDWPAAVFKRGDGG